MNLDFNAQIHEYRLDGRRLPSVTEILRELGLSRDWSFLKDREFYLARGRAVHACIELHFQGREIDWESFEGAEHVRPRFEKFLLVAREGKLAPIVCEKPLASSIFGYGGMPDYLGPFGPFPLAIADWKGDALEPSYSLQIGGYRGLLVEAAQRGDIGVPAAEILHCPGFLVPLGNGGGPVRVPNLDGADVDMFRACAAVHNWKAAHLNGGGS